jgi:hypothetical protein
MVMPAKRSFWAVASVAFAASCGGASEAPARSPSPPVEVARVEEPPAQAPSAEPAPAAQEAAPPQQKQQALPPPQQQAGKPPAPAPKLGDPCSADASADPDPCGTKGRIALELDNRSATRAGEPKCKETRLPMQGVNQPYACVDNGIVHAAAVCVACRMAMAGWSARALISELTPAQAEFLQQKLGLDRGAALASAADWRRAIAAKAQKP